MVELLVGFGVLAFWVFTRGGRHYDVVELTSLVRGAKPR